MLSPAEIVDIALKNNVRLIAVTDHDTVEGVKEAVAYAFGKNITVISGIELSTYLGDTQVHILGFGIDVNSHQLAKALERQRKLRHIRNRAMIEKLRELGIDITYEEVLARADESVGRKHIADLLVEKDVVKNVKQAFNDYLAEGAKAFVCVERLTPVEGVEIIRQAGGLPVLAHPSKIRLSKEELRKLIAEMKNHGLCGMESDYFAQTLEKRREMRLLAQEFDLFVTGGRGRAEAHSTVRAEPPSSAR